MTRKPVLLTFVVFLVALSFVFMSFQPLSATPVPGETPDIILKINDLEKNLNIIDQVFGSAEAQPGQSPSAVIRQFLQGTNWIDPSRAIVFGVAVREPQSISAALVPFRQPNEGFQSSYGATLEKDYYILTLPPGQPVTISPAFKTALRTASRAKGKSFITLEVGLQQLMAKSDQQIQQMLMQMENVPQTQEMQDMPFTPRDVRKMMEDMLDTAAQLEAFELSLDITKDKLSILSEARAAAGTELDKLFVAPKGSSVLGNFNAGRDLNWRSRSYDYSGLLAILEKTFGSIYARMGIDFSDISEIMDHYTGEMAGGMSFGRDSFRFEGIDVLKDPQKAATFIKKVYLPWMEKFSQTMAAKLGEMSGQEIENPFVRAETSTVAGYKVYGAKFKMPELPQTGADVEAPMPEFLKDFEWRFTTVGRYFVYASDDKQLAKMIKKAKSLKPRSVKGPLITIDMDIGSYLEFITSMVPEVSAQFGGQMPRLGRMHITYDFKKGKALSSSSIQMKDIKKIVAYFSQGAFGTGEADLIFEDEDEKEVASDEKPEKKVDDAKEKAVYWFRKGALCSTYGNNEAAIKYFEKAIVLDPQRSGAYFEQGVSYGQLGDYEKAIALINKALAMEPQNGLYYYGRGRVYLLAGDQDMAMEDFNKAADLGDEDARNYLSYIDETQN
jgi:hypothetical protein